jgi:parallel beta-helix repeat protein
MNSPTIIRFCQVGAIAASLCVGMVTSPTQAQPNATQQQASVSGIKPPQSQQVLYVNSAIGIDAVTAGKDPSIPFRTIAFALQQAQPGTIIQLAAGTYSAQSGEVFPLALKPGITLKGDVATNGQNVVISGGGRYLSRTFARQNVAVVAEKDSTVVGVTISNSNLRGTGLWIESTNPTVQHSTFTNSHREGIFVTGTATPRIAANVFLKNGGNGISLAHEAQGEIRNNVFQETGFGLAIGGAAAPVVAENKIIQNRDGIFVSQEARPVLRNNAIENNQRDGIAIAACSEARIDLAGNNTFNNNGQYDIHNGGANPIVLVGGTIKTAQEAPQGQCY